LAEAERRTQTLRCEQSTGNYGHTHCPSHGGAFFWPSPSGE
jgi:hypothetical protein